MKVNFNGQILDPSQAKISIFDHGFLFGDSVYEVVRTYGGKVFQLKEHLDRLAHSAEQMVLPLELSYDEWYRRIENTLNACDHHMKEESYVRIIVTRGEGEISLDPSSCHNPAYILIAKPLPLHPKKCYTEGIKISLVNTRRNLKGAVNPNIKSGNYLNNLLALMDAKKVGASEGVMLNSRGYVTEGTTSNIFMVRDNAVFTPRLEAGILRGITRTLVISIAEALDIPVESSNLLPEDLLEADEVFITSTTREVMPVQQIDDREIGSSCPGPITVQLMEEFHRQTQKNRSQD